MYISRPGCELCGTKHFLNQECPVPGVNKVNRIDLVSNVNMEAKVNKVNKVDCTAGDAEWEMAVGYLVGLQDKEDNRRAYMKDYMRRKRHQDASQVNVSAAPAIK